MTFKGDGMTITTGSEWSMYMYMTSKGNVRTIGCVYNQSAA